MPCDHQRGTDISHRKWVDIDAIKISQRITQRIRLRYLQLSPEFSISLHINAIEVFMDGVTRLGI